MAELRRVAAECGLSFAEMIEAMEVAIEDIKRARRGE